MIVTFILIALLFSGCDKNLDNSLTGDMLYRNTGDFETVSVTPDAITVTDTYTDNIGNLFWTLAGEYNNLSAFSVYKFSFSHITVDSLLTSYLRFDVANLWKEGQTAEFEVYLTNTDWEDSTRLELHNFIPVDASLISTYSDTSGTISTISFEISADIITSFTDEGAFLIKNADGNSSMISLYSDNSYTGPKLILVDQLEDGALDSTYIRPIDGNHYIGPVEPLEEPIPSFVSEGGASGYVLHIALPDSIPSMASINKCLLNVKVESLGSVLSVYPMTISVYELTSAFTTIENVQINNSFVPLIIFQGINTYELDIADFVEHWHLTPESNFGLLFKPDITRVTPNQVVLSYGDSLSISYTTLPEVK